MRVVFAIYSLILLSFVVWMGGAGYQIFIESPVFLVVPVLFLLFSVWIFYVGVLGSEVRLRKVLLYLDGGEIVGLVLMILVLFLALPVWEIIRRLKAMGHRD